MRLSSLIGALFVALASATASGAASGPPLPEPGTFELLALGGVVAIVLGIRNRRKK